MLLAATPRLKNQTPIAWQHRWVMLELSCTQESNLLPDDSELKRNGPTRTIDTVRELHGSQDSPVVLIVGDDAAAKIPLWSEFDELLNRACFLILKREKTVEEVVQPNIKRAATPDQLFHQAGHFYWLDLQIPQISSSGIRSCIEKGQEIDSGWLHPDVATYIIENELYHT